MSNLLRADSIFADAAARRTYWLIAACFAGLLAVAWPAGNNVGAFFALNGLGATLGLDQSALWIGFWSGLTLLADTLPAVVLLLPFVWRKPELVWLAVLAGVVATLVVHDIKPAMNLMRPAGVYPESVLHIMGHTLTSKAFPSGHATTALVTAGVFALGLRLPWWGLLIAAALGSIFALSRIMVGAHWPQDILAGALIGWLAAGLGMRLIRCFPLNLRWGRPILALILIVVAVQTASFDGGYPEGRWVVIPLLLWAVLGSAWVLWSVWRKKSSKTSL
ncbi:MAG: phosphatase PAP2 family protein [Halothiobacillaceae bacterium]